jgi:hypothetical protein
MSRNTIIVLMGYDVTLLTSSKLVHFMHVRITHNRVPNGFVL